MAGSTADNPAISSFWMLVDNEAMVRRILILTDSRLQQRSSLQGRKSKLQIAARRLNTFEAGHAVAVGWIKTWSTGIVRQFEPSPLASGNAIEEILSVVDPNRQLLFEESRVTSRRAKEKDLLPRGRHSIANQFRKKTSQPRPAGKNVVIGRER